MYKALNYWVFGGFGPAKTPYEFIDFAAAQGLDGVELTVGDCISAEIIETDARELAAYAKEKGVGLKTIATLAGWKTWLCSADEAERTEAKDFCRTYLQIAAWLGAETVLVVPGAVRLKDKSRQMDYGEAWQYATESIRELLPEAERLGVNIGVENVGNSFLLAPMEWKLFVDQFGSDRIGMYFDIGNCEKYMRPENYIRLLGRRIKAVHVKNWSIEDGFGENILEGDVDVASCVRALQAVGYTGPLTAEMIPMCRGANLRLPDYDLSVFTARQMKTL